MKDQNPGRTPIGVKPLLTILWAMVLLFSHATDAQTAYTWNGTVSTDWNNAQNWTPNGVPVDGDHITIPTSSNIPVMDQAYNLENVSLNNGNLDLGGYQLTATGTVFVTGSGVSNGEFIVNSVDRFTSFSNAVMDAKTDVSTTSILIGNSQFNEYTVFNMTPGSFGSISGSGTGGNTFNDSTFFNCSGNGNFYLGQSLPDVFNGPVSFDISDAVNFRTAWRGLGNQFNDNISVMLRSPNVIFSFGSNGGTSTLLSGKTLDIQTQGPITNGGMMVGGMTMDTPLNLIIPDGNANITNHHQLGATVTVAAGSVFINNSTFDAPVDITKTGNTTDNNTGGNTFNQPVTMNLTAQAGSLNFAGPANITNIFNDALTVINSTNVGGAVYFGKAEYNGDVRLQANTNGDIHLAYRSLASLRGNLTVESGGNRIKIAEGNGKLLIDGNENQTITHDNRWNAVSIDTYNLEINKPAGRVLLSTELNMTHQLTLTNGIVNVFDDGLVKIADNATVTGASNASYIFGKVNKRGNTDFTFPVGAGNQFRPLQITAPSGVYNLTAEFLSRQNRYGAVIQNCTQVSSCENWELTNGGGDVTFNTAISNENSCETTATNPAMMVQNGQEWSVLGSTTDATGKFWEADAAVTSKGNKLTIITPGEQKDAGTISQLSSLTDDTYRFFIPTNSSFTYTWSITPGWSIVSGQNTSVLTVSQDDPNAFNATVSVSYSDGSCTSLLSQLAFTGKIPYQQFAYSYGVPAKEEVAFRIYDAPDGGYLIHGEADLSNSGPSLVKLNDQYEIEWVKTFGTPGIKWWRYHFSPTTDGYYFALSNDRVIGKLDLNGNMLWTKQITTLVDKIDDINTTPDGGFAISGQIHSFLFGYYRVTDMYIAKYDENGDEEWVKMYGNKLDQVWWEGKGEVSITADDGFMITGRQWYGDKPVINQVLIKTDSLGDIEFSRLYGIDQSRGELRGSFDPIDNGYLFAGTINIPTWGGTEAVVFQVSNSGNFFWGKAFGNAGDATGPNAVLAIKTSDGFILSEGNHFLKFSGAAASTLESQKKLTDEIIIWNHDELATDDYLMMGAEKYADDQWDLLLFNMNADFESMMCEDTSDYQFRRFQPFVFLEYDARVIDVGFTYQSFTPYTVTDITHLYPRTDLSTEIPTPEDAGDIVGPTEVCPNTVVVYQIPPLNDVDFYEWKLPDGFVQDSTMAEGTVATTENNISVLVTEDFQGGKITVKGVHNNCGEGQSASLDVTVLTAPQLEVNVLSHASCSDDTGSLLITTDGNVYSIFKDGETTPYDVYDQIPVNSSPVTVSSLPAGIYKITVDNASCTTTSEDVTILSADGPETFHTIQRWEPVNYAQAVSLHINDQNERFLVGGYTGASVTLGGVTIAKTNQYNEGVFLMKYRGKDNVVWLKSLEASSLEDVQIVTNNAGQIAVAGRFRGTLSMGDGAFQINPPGGTFGIFVAMLEADGSVKWLRAIDANLIEDLQLDAAGSPYVFVQTLQYEHELHKFNPFGGPGWRKTDVFAGDIGPDQFLYALEQESGTLYLNQYHLNGNSVWRHAITGGAPDEVHVSENGKIFLEGFFNGSDPVVLADANGTTPLTPTDGGGNFIARYSAGGTLEMAQQSVFGEAAYFDIRIDPKGSIYMLGYPGGNSRIGSTTYQDDYNSLLLAKFGENGNSQWVQSISSIFRYSGVLWDFDTYGIDEAAIAIFPGSTGEMNFGDQKSVATSYEQLFVADVGYIQSTPFTGTPVIAGNGQVCEGATETYQVTGVTGARTYQWTLPPLATATNGSVIASSPATVIETSGPSLSISYPSGALGGELRVTVNGTCGSSATALLTISVSQPPGDASIVTGDSNTCSNLAAFFSTSPIDRATEYLWTFTPDQPGANPIVISTATPELSYTVSSGGSLTVQGSNNCGTGLESAPLLINSNQAPAVTVGSNSLTECSNAAGGTLEFDLSFAGAATYTVLKDGLVYSGQRNLPASQGLLTLNSLALGNYTVDLKTTNGCSASASAAVTDGSPVVTNIRSSYITCDPEKLPLFSNSKVVFDVAAGKVPDNFKNYTYSITDGSGNVIVPETTIDHLGDPLSVSSIEVLIPSPQISALYQVNLIAYQELDAATTSCTVCTVPYCEAAQSFGFRSLPVSVGPTTGSPQYVCDAAGTTDIEITVGANHNNGLSLEPAGGFKLELLDENGTLISSETVATLPLDNILRVRDVGIGQYTLRFTAGLDNYVCEAEAEFEVEDLEVEIEVETVAESCIDAEDGQASTIVTGAKKTVTYEWQTESGMTLTDDQGQVLTASAVTGLAPGNYKVIVTVAGICPNEKLFTIDPYEPLVDSLEVSVAEQACKVVASAHLTTTGEQLYPGGPYQITWYQLPIDTLFTAGDEQDDSKYQQIHQNSVAPVLSATVADVTDTIPDDKLVFRGWYYIEVTGPDGCLIKGDPYEIEKPLRRKVFDISFRWKTPEISPVEPELPDFDLKIAFDEAKEDLAKITEQCVEEEQQKVAATFRAECLPPDDQLEVTYQQRQHHYMLYYFDRAGQLTQTVPPAGVDVLADNELDRTVRPEHTMRTTYNYNSLGQVMNQHTPDGGTKNYVYDDLGRVRFSQNGKQKDEDAFAYTKYDNLGRVVEAGRGTDFSQGGNTLVFPMNDFEIPASRLNDALSADNSFPQAGRSEQVITVYNEKGRFSDGKEAHYFDEGNTQTFLRNKVSYTLTFNQGSADTVKTYFSYDPHGNIKWIIQDIPGVDYKMHLAYDYDLISGNVNMVRFNDHADRSDKFYHRYSYDESNRLVQVETSKNGQNWDKDATYDYYLHGPLKRTELGEDKIQGCDYAYTIHGWIKGMNSPILNPSLDIGGDGTLASDFAPDVWGMSLNFYDGDFIHQNGSSVFDQTGVHTIRPDADHDLFNGNIATWATTMRGVNKDQEIRRGFQYKYDRLQRLISANLFGWDGNSWSTEGNNALHTNYTYDGNGNLLTLNRYDETGSLLDELTYSYKTKTIKGISQQINQLAQVTDAVAGNKISKEITGTNDFEYDDIGNLIHDDAEDIRVVWNIQGKVSEVRPSDAQSQKPHIRYWYDAMGNRLKKEVSHDPVSVAATDNKGGYVRSFTDNPELIKVSYYSRDLNGNVIAIYESEYEKATSSTTLLQKELNILSRKRIGMMHPDVVLSDAAVTTNTFSRQSGQKRYELHDHLDNVRSVVSDQKRYLEEAGNFTQYANVRTFKNHYPFGMEHPGDNIDPMLTTMLLPTTWDVYEMEGWSGDLLLDPKGLKVALEEVPLIAKWTIGKELSTVETRTYQLLFDLQFSAADDLTLIIVVEDIASGAVIKDQTYTQNGSYELVFNAISDQTRLLFYLEDPTPTIGSSIHLENLQLDLTDYGDYRYGFNGKENDHEWGKLIQDYGFRLYNPALAKFLSVDPLAPEYPWNSTYAFAEGDVIRSIDLDGGEKKNKTTYIYQRDNSYVRMTPKPKNKTAVMPGNEWIPVVANGVVEGYIAYAPGLAATRVASWAGKSKYVKWLGRTKLGRASVWAGTRLFGKHKALQVAAFDASISYMSQLTGHIAADFITKGEFNPLAAVFKIDLVAVYIAGRTSPIHVARFIIDPAFDFKLNGDHKAAILANFMSEVTGNLATVSQKDFEYVVFDIAGASFTAVSSVAKRRRQIQIEQSTMHLNNAQWAQAQYYPGALENLGTIFKYTGPGIKTLTKRLRDYKPEDKEGPVPDKK